jgi:putative transposase
MKTTSNNYRGHRFPIEIISHGVWLYYRFSLSLPDVEELLAKRVITVTHETIRQWCRRQSATLVPIHHQHVRLEANSHIPP